MPAQIPAAERGGVRDLELGKAVERVRGAWRLRTILKESLKGIARPGTAIPWCTAERACACTQPPNEHTANNQMLCGAHNMRFRA